MTKLILEFYIPAFLITTVIVMGGSGIYFFFSSTRKKIKSARNRRRYVYDLFVIDLLIIPVASFATLALFVVVRSL